MPHITNMADTSIKLSEFNVSLGLDFSMIQLNLDGVPVAACNKKDAIRNAEGEVSFRVTNILQLARR